jgi:hypothetical protein
VTASATLDLRTAVARAPLCLLGVDALSTAELAQAREHWRVHMAAEFASARVFAGVLPQMMRVARQLDHP